MKTLPALLTAALFASRGVLFAAEAPTITVSKSEAVPVSITALSGADGAAATKVLQNDLALSGACNVSGGAGANFKISGVSSGSGLQGKVVDAAGRTVLEKTYSGSARGKVHQFADDIVETVTGARGI